MGGKNVTGSRVVNGLDQLVKENNNIFGFTGSEMSRGHLDLFLEVKVRLWKDKPYPH